MFSTFLLKSENRSHPDTKLLFEKLYNNHLIYFYSCPFKEPGGYCLSSGGSGDALPGPHQAAWARLRAGGGGQGKVSHQYPYISGMDTGVCRFYYARHVNYRQNKKKNYK